MDFALRPPPAAGCGGQEPLRCCSAEQAGSWKTAPFPTHGEISSAGARSPRRLKSKASFCLLPLSPWHLEVMLTLQGAYKKTVVSFLSAFPMFVPSLSW